MSTPKKTARPPLLATQKIPLAFARTVALLAPLCGTRHMGEALIYGENIRGVDADTSEIMRDELVAAQDEDLRALVEFLSRLGATGELRAAKESYPALVRALTTLRFRLQGQYFDDISDEGMHSPEILSRLPPEHVPLFLWYQVLTDVQSALVDRMLKGAAASAPEQL